jgi:nucleotide-binding universal stress UspA family protein
MDSIIVGTDGSAGAQAAVDEASRLAAALGHRVVLVTAYAGAHINMSAATAGMPGVPIPTADGRGDAEAVLEQAADRLRAQGVPCDTRAVCGSPAEALVDVAALEHATAIVVGSRGMRGPRRVLGSVPNTVSHKAPCSVMIVRTD